MENNNPLSTTSTQPQTNTQPAPQPVSPQFTPAMANPTPAPNNSKKKLWLIIGCTIGAIAVIALIVFLIIFFINNGNKTVSCTTHNTIMGVSFDGETNFNIENNKIAGGDLTINLDLKALNEKYSTFAEREQETVDDLIERYRDDCEEHCVFDSDYVAGDHVKIMMKYDEEGVDNLIYTYGIEDKSAQEIADKVQETMERDDDTTCKQS